MPPRRAARRRTERLHGHPMQIHKPACVGLGCRPIQFRGKLGLSISAALYFPFRTQAPFALWTEASMWRFLAQEMSEPLIDEGVLKTTPEYLVHAVAHPPSKPALSCAVRARVGNRTKTLVVHGDRVWRGRDASAATPFDSMPLNWQRAYGGADYPANPVGLGRTSPVAPDGSSARPMPNTEYAQTPLTHPDQEIVPAGFGRLDPTWSTRAQHRGTYDEKWLPDHAPAFPPDLHWRHFNMAPPDQWFDKPLLGDEPFEFDHLHPTLAKVGGRLPGLRCRSFVHYCDGPLAGKLRDIPLALSTLWFFPHAERGVMIFQGLADITQDDAADVGVLMGAVERVGEPKSDEHYLQVLQRREDPRLGGLYGLIDSDLTPAQIDNVDPDMAAIEADYKIEGFLGEAQYRGAEVKVELARQRTRELGLDPDVLGVRMPPREPTPTLSELPAHIERMLRMSAEENTKAIAAAARDVQRANEVAKAHGIDLEKQQVKGPPSFKAAAQLHALIGTLKERPDAAAGARELLAIAPKLVEAEAALKLAYRTGAHLQAPADRLPPGASTELKAQVVRALAAGHSLAHVDLTGADLSGLDLSGADLQGAHLERCDLSGARLRGANLTCAVLAHATLSGADFGKAQLSSANLGATTMRGAQFDEADLGHAILSGAKLDGASFRAANLVGVQLLDTVFGACDWRGVRASGVLFLKLELGGLSADGADLSSCNFLSCRLAGARFAGARLTGANFLECFAPGVIWTGAHLVQAVFAKGCDLSGGEFSMADMSKVNLRGARLANAILARARLDAADLSAADLTDADLGGASLRQALLIRTDLQRARGAASNWMNAVAQKVDLRGADLRASNLFGSDLSQAHLDQATLLQQALAERVKVHPKRRPTSSSA